jgi:hypothetical protein
MRCRRLSNRHCIMWDFHLLVTTLAKATRTGINNYHPWVIRRSVIISRY